MRNLTLTVAAMLIGALAGPAQAIEPLTASELAGYCNVRVSDTEPGRVCVVYITGFLDGAVATDAQVAQNVVNELERSGSFTERAMRTRLTRRLTDVGPTAYADFCVGNPVPVAEVIAHVVDELNERDTLSNELAQGIVYDALRRHYPCRVIE